MCLYVCVHFRLCLGLSLSPCFLSHLRIASISAQLPNSYIDKQDTSFTNHTSTKSLSFIPPSTRISQYRTWVYDGLFRLLVSEKDIRKRKADGNEEYEMTNMKKSCQQLCPDGRETRVSLFLFNIFSRHLCLSLSFSISDSLPFILPIKRLSAPPTICAFLLLP